MSKTETKSQQNRLIARLSPLYVAAFFQGFVLLYSIEKVFMKQIGFDDASIGLMIAVYSTVMLVAETPSGILADRWSRKGVLILASLALGTFALIGGVSDGKSTYFFAAACWGVFFALYSGTYDSIVYDTLLEETGTGEGFEKYAGRVSIADSTALVVSSISGGLVANWLGVRYAYYLTVPFTLLSIVALVMFKEPKLHKSVVAVPTFEHVRNTFSAVTRQKSLRPLIIVLILVLVCKHLLLEFSQLWYIALDTPLVLFGFLNAILMTTFGIGGFLAQKVAKRKESFHAAVLLTMFISAVCLVLSRNLFLSVASIFVLVVSSASYNIVCNKILHDNLQSRIRAGAASAVSTMGRLLLIPISLIFGSLSQSQGIFDASWLIVALVISLACAAYFGKRTQAD